MTESIRNKIQNIRLLAMDFDGVHTDNRVLVGEDGKEMVVCCRSDSLGIDLLKRKRPDIRLVVISKEKNPVVQSRCRKLGIECMSGIDDKQKALKGIMKQGKYSRERVAYMGNDMNDLDCITMAGIGIAVADSAPPVLEAADYITQEKGGCGAIREITDMILSTHTENP